MHDLLGRCEMQRYYLYGKDDLGNEYEALVRTDD